jgi:hypothetical protein
VLVERTNIVGNSWGVINGDVSQWSSPWIFTGTTGVASPNFNDVFFMDTFEANTAGAAIEGLTVGTQYLNNYIEANPRGVVLGMAENPITVAQYTALYGITFNNGGTAFGSSVNGDFWNLGSSLHSMVELRASGSANIEGNATSGSGTACTVDVFTATAPYVGPNASGATTQLCQGGFPGWPFVNQMPAGLNANGNLSNNGTFATGQMTQTGVFSLNNGTGISTGSVGGALGTIGPWTLYATQVQPVGLCTAGSLDLGTFGLAVCQAGNWVTK